MTEPKKGFVPTPSDFMTIQELKDDGEWPLPYIPTLGLVPYIKRMQGDVKGIEIGTGRGESTYLILEKCPNVVEMTTIDPFEAYEDWIGPIDQRTLDQFKRIAEDNLKIFGPRANLVSEKSHKAVFALANDEYDFLFVDGDHSQERVKLDLIDYYHKIRSGGIIAVHDCNLNTVYDGLKEFLSENKLRQPLNRLPNGVLFWIKH